MNRKHTLPIQTRLASVQPTSINAESRTVDVIWSSGAAVRRYDWWAEEEFTEELDLSGARLDRLNAGAPVLDSHNARELEHVIGVVERAWIEGDNGMATIRLSEREQVEPIWRDLKSGILRNISVGYAIYEIQRTDRSGGLPVVRVTDFEPMELSIVAIPADSRAQVRDAAHTYPVVIRQERTMADQPATEPLAADPAITEPVTEPETTATEAETVPVDVQEQIRAAITADRATERERVKAITARCAQVNMPHLAARLIDADATLAQAETAIVDAWVKSGGSEIRQTTAPKETSLDVAAIQRRLFNQVAGKE